MTSDEAMSLISILAENTSNHYGYDWFKNPEKIDMSRPYSNPIINPYVTYATDCTLKKDDGLILD